MDYQTKLRRFLNNLYCINCGMQDLFGRLSCLIFSRYSMLFLAWCLECESKGKEVINAQKSNKA